MPTSTNTSLIAQLITPEMIDYVSTCVAKKLSRRCAEPLEAEELHGWARLGVAIAIESFDDEVARDSKIVEPKSWVCGYLNRKGFFAAIDEMRSAHVIGRLRGDRYYDCKTVSTRGMDDDHADVAYASGNCGVTEDSVDLKELIGVVVKQLTGLEKQVFQLRYQEGMSIADIATKLNIRRGRVYHINDRVISEVGGYLRGNLFGICPNKKVPAAA